MIHERRCLIMFNGVKLRASKEKTVHTLIFAHSPLQNVPTLIDRFLDLGAGRGSALLGFSCILCLITSLLSTVVRGT